VLHAICIIAGLFLGAAAVATLAGAIARIVVATASIAGVFVAVMIAKGQGWDTRGLTAEFDFILGGGMLIVLTVGLLIVGDLFKRWWILAGGILLWLVCPGIFS